MPKDRMRLRHRANQVGRAQEGVLPRGQVRSKTLAASMKMAKLLARMMLRARQKARVQEDVLPRRAMCWKALTAQMKKVNLMARMRPRHRARQPARAREGALPRDRAFLQARAERMKKVKLAMTRLRRSLRVKLQARAREVVPLRGRVRSKIPAA
jgi:hypothetical protein